jgi:hypothetical protein
VPPHFGDAQRAATGMAATLAGVGRHVTLYEPVNPILAYARCERWIVPYSPISWAVTHLDVGIPSWLAPETPMAILNAIDGGGEATTRAIRAPLGVARRAER